VGPRRRRCPSTTSGVSRCPFYDSDAGNRMTGRPGGLYLGHRGCSTPSELMLQPVPLSGLSPQANRFYPFGVAFRSLPRWFGRGHSGLPRSILATLKGSARRAQGANPGRMEFLSRFNPDGVEQPENRIVRVRSSTDMNQFCAAEILGFSSTVARHMQIPYGPGGEGES